MNAYSTSNVKTYLDSFYVTLAGGVNATPSGEISQSVSRDTAMTEVTYTANDWYHFEAFSAITKSGITVTRSDDATIVVSGTPIDDTSITSTLAGETGTRYTGIRDAGDNKQQTSVIRLSYSKVSDRITSTFPTYSGGLRRQDRQAYIHGWIIWVKHASRDAETEYHN